MNKGKGIKKDKVKGIKKFLGNTSSYNLLSQYSFYFANGYIKATYAQLKRKLETKGSPSKASWLEKKSDGWIKYVKFYYQVLCLVPILPPFL